MGDVVSTVKQEENDAAAIGLVKQEILAHLVALDESGDGKISHDELEQVIRTPHSKALFRRLKINFPFFVELQKGAFGSKPIPIKDVLELMVMSRGDNVVTVESMAGALVTITNELVGVKTALEEDLARIEARLSRSSQFHHST